MNSRVTLVNLTPNLVDKRAIFLRFRIVMYYQSRSGSGAEIYQGMQGVFIEVVATKIGHRQAVGDVLENLRWLRIPRRTIAGGN